VAGFLNRLDNGFDVEGLDGTQVDDFGVDAVLFLELLSGNERLADAAGKGYNGEVCAGALDLGFAEGDDKSSLWASSLMGKERP